MNARAFSRDWSLLCKQMRERHTSWMRTLFSASIQCVRVSGSISVTILLAWIIATTSTKFRSTWNDYSIVVHLPNDILCWKCIFAIRQKKWVAVGLIWHKRYKKMSFFINSSTHFHLNRTFNRWLIWFGRHFFFIPQWITDEQFISRHHARTHVDTKINRTL